MRKAKPKKVREIKVNETKIIKTIVRPSDKELDRVALQTHLLNLPIACERHREVWNREENGYLNPYYKMLIGKCINLARAVYANNFSGKDELSDDPYSKREMSKAIALCEPIFGKKPRLTQDDIVQKLPAGFMASLGAWARILRELEKSRMRNLIRELGIENEIKKILDASDKYMRMLYEEVVWVELL